MLIQICPKNAGRITNIGDAFNEQFILILHSLLNHVGLNICLNRAGNKLAMIIDYLMIVCSDHA